MTRGCRDCPRCTEMALASLILLPIRFSIWIMTFWNVGLLVRKCPECRHAMGGHRGRH